LRKARSVMEQLVRECNESIYLVVQCGREVLFLYVIDSIQQVKVASLVGRRFPLESSAAGQVIRAFGASPGASSAGELESILRSGIARDEDALGEGIASLAVPLIRGGGKVAGALVMLWPDFRVPDEGVDSQFVPALKMAGEIVSARLGYRGYENSIGARGQAAS